MAEPIRKTYVLNDHHYYQEEIKFIQFRELLEIVAPVWDYIQDMIDLAAEDKKINQIKLPNKDEIIKFLGDDILKVAAILIIPENKKVKEREVYQAVEDLEVEPVKKTMEIVTDFFGLNDLLSLIRSATQVVSAAAGKSISKKSTGKKSNSTSQAGTSLKESASSTKSPPASS